jgi:hypothetical protein
VKITEPVGVPELGVTVFTVAVNVTTRPNADWIGEAVTAVELAAGTIVCVNKADALAFSRASPTYAAAIGLFPTGSVLVVNTACPIPFRTAAPSRTGP